MKNSLIAGLNASARTTNGMRANATTFSKNVDLFFAIGASRGKDVSKLFADAKGEDTDIAVRILQWSRDVRGGAGERQIFRSLIRKLATGAKKDVTIVSKLLAKIPEIGRWDDLLELMGTPLEADVAYFIGEALAQKNGLTAKWMPRKGENAKKLATYWGLSPKQYRKLLVTLTNVVETKMCAKDWEAIEFDKLPSLASARYQKAFSRNAESAYTVYRNSLEKGTTTINAGAVFPYDIVKSMQRGDQTVANAQWLAQPDYMAGSDQNILVVADVSASMNCAAGDNPNVRAIDVCISLALYVSERSRGAFKDAFLTFSEKPTLQVLTSKKLADRYSELNRAKWDMSTNLEGAFREVLRVAVRDNVPQGDMPTTILLMSDMQFNQCVKTDDTAMQNIRRQYKDAGYEVPQVVFWNIKAHPGTNPATVNDKGVALVSGASPSILKAILGGKDFTPEGMMMEAVRQTRYDWQ